jgi:nucleoside-diphosphate-sugar epimerase
MKKNSVSIVGSGWLGLPLAEHLIQQGYPVNLSTRRVEKLASFEQFGARPYLIDIDQLTFSDDFFDSDILICNITSKNQAGFTRLIEQIALSSIQHVLFISSSSVYLNTHTIVTENDDAEDSDSVLFQIEQAFQSCSHFDTTILRLSGLIGYQRHPGRFFSHGKVVSQPDAPVNLIHRDDCIGLISQIIEQSVWGDVFNGCADTHPSKRQFYSHARHLLDKPPPTFSDQTHGQTKTVSNAKIKQRLGYRFIYPDVMQIPFNEMG